MIDDFILLFRKECSFTVDEETKAGAGEQG